MTKLPIYEIQAFVAERRRVEKNCTASSLAPYVNSSKIDKYLQGLLSIQETEQLFIFSKTIAKNCQNTASLGHCGKYSKNLKIDL